MPAPFFSLREASPVRPTAYVLRPENPKPHIDVSSRFGVRLRELRRENNLTQLQMAIDFGIDRSYISDVERGCKAVSLPMLEIMALGFNLSLSDLFRNL